MEHFVYIIQSEVSCGFCKGYTSYPLLRIEEHNKGQSRFTANKGPWKLVYPEKMENKTAALIREKQLKKSNTQYIKWLINQDTNIVNI